MIVNMALKKIVISDRIIILKQTGRNNKTKKYSLIHID